VRNSNNSTIGKAEGINPRHAAIFFFFSMP
jgi:hypothetical protein